MIRNSISAAASAFWPTLRTSVVACALIVGALVTASLAAPGTARPAPKVRIALAGDSTVTDGAGWGKGFAEWRRNWRRPPLTWPSM